MNNFGKLEISNQTVNLKWKLENYSSFSENKEIETIRSPVFDGNWLIKLYPRGNQEAARGYTSIYLCNNRDVQVKASYTCYLINEAGEKIKLYTIVDHNYYQRREFCSGWGVMRAIKQSDLMDPAKGMLVNDTLMLLFEISTDDDYVMLSDISEEFQEFEKLLDSENLSDVAFNVKSKRIRAHKAILSARSSVFEAMFQHDMKENQENVVEIEDMEYDVFLELLRFIYAGKVNNMKNVALDLLVAADRYAIDGLKSKCESVLISIIDTDNVVEYLKVADACSAFLLKEAATSFCKNNAKDVVLMAQFEEFAKKYPRLSVEVTRVMICHLTPKIMKITK